MARIHPLRTLCVLAIALAACNGGGDDEPKPKPKNNQNTGPEASPFRSVDKTSTTDGEGFVYVELDVEPGDKDMLVTLSTFGADDAIYFDEVYDPDFVKVFDADQAWDSDHSLTYAYWPDFAASFNWPILPGQQLDAGKWTFKVATASWQTWRSVGNVDFQVRAQLSDDPSFAEGTLDVNVIYTGGMDQDPTVVAAVDEAIAQWSSIYGAVDIDATFRTSVYPGPELFEPPSYGTHDLYELLMGENELGTINLVVVPEFTGQGGAWTLGLAGGIPGPLVPTGVSAVAVNVSAHWGNDMKFSADEQRIFAETMAHEVGHYLGLFHPVESDYRAWDSLDDTPECSSGNDCEDKLSSNLMFPYTVCNGNNCTPQNQLTDDQKATTMRYVGVY